MRRFLLDTHVFVWLIEEPSRITRSLLDELSDLDNEVFLSAASFWEIAVNRNRGRMKFAGNVTDEMLAAKFRELPVTGAHYEAAVVLAEIHKDPFDRLLVAQALAEGLILVTRDKLLAAYNVPMIRV